jgi:folate-binding protein YgfZ
MRRVSPASSPGFIAELTRRAVIRVAGPDSRGFLQGLLTQDVEGLAPGDLRFSAMLTPQGRFLFDLFLAAAPEADAVLLDVEAARRDDLIRRLGLYRLRAKVEIAADDARVFAAWGDRPDADAWCVDPRLAELGWRAFLSDAPAGSLATEDAYDAWRLALGVPDPVVDCAPDGGYPIEFDFDLLNGIDFHKGCFVGQETTSRMKRRGQIKTRTLPLDFDGPAPAPGAEILAGDLRAGEVLSGRDGRALALVRLDRIEGAELTVDGRPVRIVRPGWWPEAAG